MDHDDDEVRVPSNEYPKALYIGGTFSQADVDALGHVTNTVTVENAAQEAAAAADGYFPFGQAEKPRKHAPAPVGDPSVPSELETLKAEAIAKGIDVKHNWGVKKLREVLAA